ncbi:Glycine cleavage system transcriptional activator [Defluviimonas aquaemixtae]|uniref:Glycine cleavage system transcriptional activator n=1 Tax=Albidovulum aquaemixtae TaxID=1542388 RepID=A0A2R8BJB1_9RHOB|nr:LysR substrate-binding domain-containing protein [Defluviimonas aquaemixtae]SPH23495.1 Glycine cleavage system transcriptional activator [Defluviimonas aquaemixtae]
MRFHHYDSLRIFSIVARHKSFAAAAEELNLTKGAVSHQIRGLEQALGFPLFNRLPRGISLTPKGQDLWMTLGAAFDTVEARIADLRMASERPITIGVTTYFASRWLSPRLMLFMKTHPRVRLRIQPMIDLSELGAEGIDLAIRWGRGDWTDVTIRPLFLCPAFATGPPEAHALIREVGLEAAIGKLTLLADRSGSRAWEDWNRLAGLRFTNRTDVLTIADPNVRVQAVIDGQGIALNDALVEREIEAGLLVRLTDHQLDDYGYFLAHEPGATRDPHVGAFADWLLQMATASK